ncbi:MAG TPA: histidine phosphatase family protein [Xanthomonadaceae bacterium]|nr:histidine phosphatase family protein [Xanthomonadaceae bacterium]
MGELLLVRHGQASAGSADYDQLSLLGRRQAERLGRWLLAQRRPLAGVVRGDLVRHRDTLHGIVAVFQEDGCPLPDVRVDPDLNEFDFKSLLTAELGRRGDGQRMEQLLALPQRELFLLLRGTLLAWTRGELDHAVGERWQDFRDRVHAAAARLAEDARGAGPQLVVSSGGVMSLIAQKALDLPDARAIDLNFTIRNSALSEFVAGPDGLMLRSWNALPHLADPDHAGMHTYY